MNVMLELSPRTFWWRTLVVHVCTYALVGLLAMLVLDYPRLYAETTLQLLMRPTTSAWVAAGPALQLIRGSLYAGVLWPLRGQLLTGEFRVLYGLLVGLAILGPAGPAPGSLEGLYFTRLSPSLHLIGLPEVLLQTAAFTFLLRRWCARPRRWMNVAGGVGLALVLLFSVLGVLDALLPGGLGR